MFPAAARLNPRCLCLPGSPSPPTRAPPDPELGDEPGNDPFRSGCDPEDSRHEDLSSSAIQGFEGRLGDPLGRDHEPAGEAPDEQARLWESLGLDWAGIDAQHPDPARGELGRDIP